MYIKKFRIESAHEASIWCLVMRFYEKENVELVVSGSVDNSMKIWFLERDKIQLRHTCTGNQLGIISVDINKSCTNVASW